MKKLNSILLALISVICVAFAFVGCGNNEAREKGNVGPITESNESSNNVKKLEAGKFYTVTEAYENGYLTRDDVMSIAYYHNGGRKHNESIMDENYKPLLKTHEKLSDETEAAIKQSYIDVYFKDKDLNYIEELLGEKLKISIDEYYGTYNGCVASMMTDNWYEVNCAEKLEQIAGINIYYNNGNRIEIWGITE